MYPRAKADKFYPAGVSGMHVVYVTYDLPIDTGLVEDGVTLHRMKKTIAWFGKAWAAGKRKPADLIESVFAKFSGYVLGFEMLSRAQRTYLVRHPAALAKLEDAGFPTFMKDAKGGAWPLAEFSNYGGECQAIVRLTRAMAHQVGLPGTFQIKYVSSQPADPYKTRILDDPSVDPAGPLPGWDYALVDGAVSVGGQYGAADGVGFNRYEAFLKYTDGGVITWFGGGIGRMPASTKEDDLVKVDGKRLALGEVAGCLESFSKVKEAEVRIVTDDMGGPMVVARIVRAGVCRAEDIIDHCARNLAPYKVPRQIEFCETI